MDKNDKKVQFQCEFAFELVPLMQDWYMEDNYAYNKEFLSPPLNLYQIDWIE